MKMSELHAAVGILNLRSVDNDIESRRSLYRLYEKHLGESKGISTTSMIADRPNYSYCPILVDERKYGKSRDELFRVLQENSIYPRKYFYPLCNELDCYKNKYRQQGNLSVSRDISSRILCLPIYPALPHSSVERICQLIKHFGK